MTRVVGVDIGVRSAHIAVLEGEQSPELHVFSLLIPKQDRAIELQLLQSGFAQTSMPGEYAWIEEPPYVNNLRIFMSLSQTLGVLLAAGQGKTSSVDVSTWKLGVTGNGSSNKAAVASHLALVAPSYFQQCGGDQNKIDAVSIALYGWTARFSHPAYGSG